MILKKLELWNFRKFKADEKAPTIRPSPSVSSREKKSPSSANTAPCAWFSRRLERMSDEKLSR